MNIKNTQSNQIDGQDSIRKDPILIVGGFFVVFEGIDGTGKSTQLHLLAEKLQQFGYAVVSTCEPTDGPYGKKIRENCAKREKTKKHLFYIEMVGNEEIKFFSIKLGGGMGANVHFPLPLYTSIVLRILFGVYTRCLYFKGTKIRVVYPNIGHPAQNFVMYEIKFFVDENIFATSVNTLF